MLWSSWVYPSGCQLFYTASQLILVPPTSVNSISTPRHRKIFFQARQNLLYPKKWNRHGNGLIARGLSAQDMPWAWHSLPSLTWAGLRLGMPESFGDEVTVSLAFRQSLCLTQLPAPLTSFCPGIMNRVYWFKGHSCSKTKSAKFTVMWKKQLPVMAHCPSCLWDA